MSKRTLEGKVVSNKMQKTIVVEVESKYAHPVFGKIIRKHKRYKVHCEDESVKDGDLVIIEEGRPKSKEKSFYFVEIVKQK